MSEPYERTFCGRVHSVRPPHKPGLNAVICIMVGIDPQYYEVTGDGSEWTPGQRVDVILRAVPEAKAEEAQDAD